MSYFLKKTKINGRVYLQISTTTYNKETGKSSNKVYHKIGFLDELTKNGINDPLTYYKTEIEKLNKEAEIDKQKNKELSISNVTNISFGHFFVDAVLNYLDVENKISRIFNTYSGHENNYNIFKSLLYCQFLNDGFALKNYEKICATMYNQPKFSKDEALETLDFAGKNIKEILSVINEQVNKKINAKNEYHYFNINVNYLNANKKSECIYECLGLNDMLIPNNMILSEVKKVKEQDLISQIKNENKNTKYIRVFDKAINYGREVYNAKNNNYGYIFPISLTKLPEADKEWILNPDSYTVMKNASDHLKYKVKALNVEQSIYVRISSKNGFIIKENQKHVASFSKQLEEKKRKEIYSLIDTSRSLFYMNADKSDYGRASKYLKLISQDDGTTKFTINEEKINNELKYAGYKLIVTNDSSIKKKDIFEIADIFWKIDDYFKKIRNQLNNIETNKNIDENYGHYLIAYLIVIVYRILETSLFVNYSSNEIYSFINSVKCLKIGDSYVNLIGDSPMISTFQSKYKTSINKVYLKDSDIRKLFSLSLK